MAIKRATNGVSESITQQLQRIQASLAGRFERKVTPEKGGAVDYAERSRLALEALEERARLGQIKLDMLIEQFLDWLAMKIVSSGKRGLHVVFDGVNTAIREGLEVDPIGFIAHCESVGLIETRIARRGAMVYIKGTAPEARAAKTAFDYKAEFANANKLRGKIGAGAALSEKPEHVQQAEVGRRAAVLAQKGKLVRVKRTSKATP